MNTNITTTGGWALWSHPQEPANTLTACGAAHMAVIIHIVPIMEVTRQALPRLPVLLTTQQMSQKINHPASLPEWSATQGGREAPAGLLT